MRGQSILATVDLGCAHDDKFLELSRNRSCVHDGAEVGDHGSKDFRPMCDRTEHVGNIASFMQIDVVNLAGFGIDFVSVQTRNSLHRVSVVDYGRAHLAGASYVATFAATRVLAGRRGRAKSARLSSF